MAIRLPWYLFESNKSAYGFFTELKQRATHTPVLNIPDPDGQFVVTTDASGFRDGNVAEMPNQGISRR